MKTAKLLVRLAKIAIFPVFMFDLIGRNPGVVTRSWCLLIIAIDLFGEIVGRDEEE